MKLSFTLFRIFSGLIAGITFICLIPLNAESAGTSKKYVIDNKTSYYINNQTWEPAPTGGDTIFILAERTRALRFQQMNGTETAPIVVINYGGQVKINSEAWGAITFENCTHIKITGKGYKGIEYGFTLAASTCGLGFSELSSDCEAEALFIDHNGFFGIFAKKDYGGNPPTPAPVFSNLSIHDCFIQNVTEGMYIGETKSPGMEFRHVRIYNNVVKNTGRESIQIANAVEDVEIYNNTLVNAGQDNINWQSNILQIGDNSVAKVFNNILMGAPSYGIISMGMGNNIFTNNYISFCKGIFTDNRLFTVSGYPIQVENNYLRDLTSTEAVKNMNEINFVEIRNNKWEGNIAFYKNASGNNNNFILANNQNISVTAITFTNPDQNDYSLAPGTPDEYKQLGAKVTGLKTIEIDTTSRQIILSSDMIVDEVAGGSYWSANYLVDEQNFNPENNIHPVSQSWKPYWNMDKAPYYVYFDLKSEYKITNIAIHDMNNSKNLKIFIGQPGNWELLFTDACDKYNFWKQHPVEINSRYIRIGMEESVYAAINEIVIYGYRLSGDQIKSGNLNALLTTANENSAKKTNEIRLNNNPVFNTIGINIPAELSKDFNIEIVDISGRRKFMHYYSHQTQNQLIIDLSQLRISNGVYLLKYSNKEGITKTLKFIRKSL